MIALAVTGMREIMGDRFLGFWLKQFSKGQSTGLLRCMGIGIQINSKPLPFK